MGKNGIVCCDCLIGWHIWKARNEWVFNKVWLKETQIIAKVLSEFHEFCIATDKKVRSSREQPESDPVNWIPPVREVT